MRGKIPPVARSRPSAANLSALRKNNGGIRPLAVGNVLRILASNIDNDRNVPNLRQELPPVQHGVGVCGWCEAATHAILELVKLCALNKIYDAIQVKLDMKGANSTVRRDHILEICKRRAPSLI